MFVYKKVFSYCLKARKWRILFKITHPCHLVQNHNELTIVDLNWRKIFCVNYSTNQKTLRNYSTNQKTFPSPPKLLRWSHSFHLGDIRCCFAAHIAGGKERIKHLRQRLVIVPTSGCVVVNIAAGNASLETVRCVPLVVARRPRQLWGEGLAEVVQHPRDDEVVVDCNYARHYHHRPANTWRRERERESVAWMKRDNWINGDEWNGMWMKIDTKINKDRLPGEVGG